MGRPEDPPVDTTSRPDLGTEDIRSFSAETMELVRTGMLRQFSGRKRSAKTTFGPNARENVSL